MRVFARFWAVFLIAETRTSESRTAARLRHERARFCEARAIAASSGISRPSRLSSGLGWCASTIAAGFTRFTGKKKRRPGSRLQIARLSSRASPVWSTRGWTGFDGAACVYAAMLVYLFAVSVSQGTPTVILNHSTLYFGIGALSLGALSWRRWSWRPRAEARPA